MLSGPSEGANDAAVQLDEADVRLLPLEEPHRALVEVDERAGALVVTPLVRQLDAECAPQLRLVLAHLIEGRRLVVISLAHVASVDCSGLAALVSGMKRLGPGGELRLACANEEVRALLAATHLDELLVAFPDADTAACP